MHFTDFTPHEMRLRFYTKQEGRCWLCGEYLDLFLPVHSFGSCSWEHIIPRNCGGSKGWKNVALTHMECNKLRGDRFIWSLRRPDWRTWNRDRKMICPAKAQRRFERLVGKLCHILRRLPENCSTVR